MPSPYAVLLGGLLEPALLRDDVRLAVAAQITGTEPVLIGRAAALLGNRDEGPWLGGIGPIDLPIAELAVLHADHLVLLVAVEIDPNRALGRGLRHHAMRSPLAFLAWVHVEVEALAGMAGHQNVVLPVA